MIGGDAKGTAQYRDMLRKTLQQLDSLLGRKAIRFEHLEEGVAAEHHEGKNEIHVDSKKLRKGADESPLTEDNLGYVSLLLVS